MAVALGRPRPRHKYDRERNWKEKRVDGVSDQIKAEILASLRSDSDSFIDFMLKIREV